MNIHEVHSQLTHIYFDKYESTKIPYSNHWLFFNHGSQLSQLNDAILSEESKMREFYRIYRKQGKGYKCWTVPGSKKQVSS